MPSQAEIRDSVTSRIVTALQAGETPPWRRPWGGINSGSPMNAVTKKPYRGVNVLLLGCQAFESRWWATYRQWSSLGGQVKRGEHGTRIVFYKPISKTVNTDEGEVETEFFLLREYVVFSVEQVEGKAVEKYLVQPGYGSKDFVDYVPAEESIQATSADIRFGGSRACYRIEDDYIQLPPKPFFKSEHDFYGTAFHELAHWSGHESRLDRLNKNARFGNESYAFEELVAEIAGCFACNELGIPLSEDLTNHQAYLGHWLGVLQQDSGAILRAAGQASKAVDYLLSFSRKSDAVTEDAEAVEA